MLEIVTPEWIYHDTQDGNFENILQVKEQRRLGTSRGNTTTPQAPVIQVRMKIDKSEFRSQKLFVKADLWSYGPSCRGKSSTNRIPPQQDGSPFTKLRGSTYITCTENIERLEEEVHGYSYATLKCFVTRGARVFCRKNHVALRLSVVAKEDGVFRELAAVQPIRTARISISEKAMCPRESDKKRKADCINTPASTTDKTNEKKQRLSEPLKEEISTVKGFGMLPVSLGMYNINCLPNLALPPSSLPLLVSAAATAQKSTLKESCIGDLNSILLKNLLLNRNALDLCSYIKPDQVLPFQNLLLNMNIPAATIANSGSFF